MLFETSVVELIDHMGDDRRAADAARVSMLSDELEATGLNERDKKLLAFLMREKHTSPFEHSVISFRILAPLPVIAQIMRHRTFSYNQASRRYTSDEILFYEMGAFRKQGAKNLQCSDGDLDFELSGELQQVYKSHCLQSLDVYNQLIESGVSREQARFVLPQALMARFWMTGNLHNFLKFLILRDDAHAQAECRDVAIQIKSHLTTLFPETMNLFAAVVPR